MFSVARIGKNFHANFSLAHIEAESAPSRSMSDSLRVMAGVEMAFQFQRAVSNPKIALEKFFHLILDAIGAAPGAFCQYQVRVKRVVMFIHLPKMRVVDI